MNYTSRQFGPLYVFRAKMPTFPNTWANTKTMPGGEVQYWSVATMASFINGSLWDGVFDMQVPVDKDGYYTIVVSLPEDRPKNATEKDGVAWINWGAGEGIGDSRNRKDWGALLMRFIVPHKDWKYSPLQPGGRTTVMGLLPQGLLHDQGGFREERGQEVEVTGDANNRRASRNNDGGCRPGPSREFLDAAVLHRPQEGFK